MWKDARAREWANLGERTPLDASFDVLPATLCCLCPEREGPTIPWKGNACDGALEGSKLCLQIWVSAIALWSLSSCCRLWPCGSPLIKPCLSPTCLCDHACCKGVWKAWVFMCPKYTVPLSSGQVGRLDLGGKPSVSGHPRHHKLP